MNFDNSTKDCTKISQNIEFSNLDLKNKKDKV